MLDQIEHRTFEYFWQTANPVNGLVPDHWPLGAYKFSSIAAVGFGLTVYPIGVERGWITREQAVQRVLTTLKFFANAPQGDSEDKDAGYHGFFYHFLDMKTGLRYGPWVEVSTVDTTWLMAGVLFDETYFDKDDPQEREIRKLAEKLYRNVDWTWAQSRPPLISMGWTPQGKFIPYDYTGLDESMMLYILALGSPTHAIKPDAWAAWTSTYKDTWGSFMGGKPHVGFAPLFGHQYTQSWIDMQGIQDAFMRAHGMTYFQNSRRSVIGQRAYAINIGTGNSDTGYGPNIWGLTACDGPGDTTWEHANGTTTIFHGYFARGADVGDIINDGTIAPTAAISSIVFAPKLVLPAIDTMYARYGKWLYSRYGFLDAFNPSFRLDVPLRSGHVVPGEGWFDNRYLGIDEGPIVLMIENYRSGFVWRVMRRNPHIRKGLERAGFAGGWLASKPATGPLGLAAPATPVTVAPAVPVSVAPVAPAPIAPAAPATVTPAAPTTVAPAVPVSVAPASPATIAPATPVVIAPVAPATIAPAVPVSVAPATPATVVPAAPTTTATHPAAASAHVGHGRSRHVDRRLAAADAPRRPRDSLAAHAHPETAPHVQ
ncbi:MAG: glucoamylase family protein [Rhodanobacteraceae bacterium]